MKNLIKLDDYRKPKRKTLTAAKSCCNCSSRVVGNYTVAENIKRINALLEKLRYKYVIVHRRVALSTNVILSTVTHVSPLVSF